MRTNHFQPTFLLKTTIFFFIFIFWKFSRSQAVIEKLCGDWSNMECFELGKNSSALKAEVVRLVLKQIEGNSGGGESGRSEKGYRGKNAGGDGEKQWRNVKKKKKKRDLTYHNMGSIEEIGKLHDIEYIFPKKKKNSKKSIDEKRNVNPKNDDFKRKRGGPMKFRELKVKKKSVSSRKLNLCSYGRKSKKCLKDLESMIGGTLEGNEKKFNLKEIIDNYKLGNNLGKGIRKKRNLVDPNIEAHTQTHIEKQKNRTTFENISQVKILNEYEIEMNGNRLITKKNIYQLISELVESAFPPFYSDEVINYICSADFNWTKCSLESFANCLEFFGHEDEGKKLVLELISSPVNIGFCDEENKEVKPKEAEDYKRARDCLVNKYRKNITSYTCMNDFNAGLNSTKLDDSMGIMFDLDNLCREFSILEDCICGPLVPTCGDGGYDLCAKNLKMTWSYYAIICAQMVNVGSPFSKHVFVVILMVILFLPPLLLVCMVVYRKRRMKIASSAYTTSALKLKTKTQPKFSQPSKNEYSQDKTFQKPHHHSHKTPIMTPLTQKTSFAFNSPTKPISSDTKANQFVREKFASKKSRDDDNDSGEDIGKNSNNNNTNNNNKFKAIDGDDDENDNTNANNKNSINNNKNVIFIKNPKKANNSDLMMANCFGGNAKESISSSCKFLAPVGLIDDNDEGGGSGVGKGSEVGGENGGDKVNGGIESDDDVF